MNLVDLVQKGKTIAQVDLDTVKWISTSEDDTEFCEVRIEEDTKLCVWSADSVLSIIAESVVDTHRVGKYTAIICESEDEMLTLIAVNSDGDKVSAMDVGEANEFMRYDKEDNSLVVHMETRDEVYDEKRFDDWVYQKEEE